jgi:hypothetical protein
MGLTSGAFELLMIAAAVAVLGCVVWAWPAVAGLRVRDLAGRAGLLVVSQALAVAAFLTCLNGYFGFFGSWSELVGPGRERPVTGVLAGGAVRSLQVQMTEPGPAPGGKVLNAEAPRAAAGGPVPDDAAPGDAAPGSRGKGRPRLGLHEVSRRAYSKSAAVAGRLLMVSMTGPRTGITVDGRLLRRAAR